MTAVAHLWGMSMSDWGTLFGLMVSVGTILFFVKKIVIKWIATELKVIKAEITPNGRDTQRTGDIVARTETKVDNLYSFMERYAEKVDKLEKDVSYLEGLIETSLRTKHD
jgi:hypothetical protein